MDVNNKDSWIEVHDRMKFKSSSVRWHVPHYGFLFIDIIYIQAPFEVATDNSGVKVLWVSSNKRYQLEQIKNCFKDCCLGWGIRT